MNRSRFTILALLVALLGTNAWWAYRAVDTAVTASYRDAVLNEHHEALAQAIAVIPLASRPDATPTQVLDAARAAVSAAEPFEKDGLTWVGHLVFRFSAQGRLLQLRPSWEPF